MPGGESVVAPPAALAASDDLPTEAYTTIGVWLLERVRESGNTLGNFLGLSYAFVGSGGDGSAVSSWRFSLIKSGGTNQQRSDRYYHVLHGGGVIFVYHVGIRTFAMNSCWNTASGGGEAHTGGMPDHLNACEHFLVLVLVLVVLWFLLSDLLVLPCTACSWRELKLCGTACSACRSHRLSCSFYAGRHENMSHSERDVAAVGVSWIPPGAETCPPGDGTAISVGYRLKNRIDTTPPEGKNWCVSASLNIILV